MVFGEHIKELNVTEDEIKEFTKELNVTEDEIKKFTQAFRDEKFRALLFDYARELSDPNKKKRYEEEIKQLEQGRGNDIRFIHIEPFRVLRTSLNGCQKCFINICSSEEIGKPEFKKGVTEDGRRGQHWSLPHSLVPGRQERDPKGNKFMIYDVVFHPDSIHLANKDKRFMSIVDNTAIQGIKDAFKVTLDENNMRELNIKYKGSPHPCMIRKPISGFIPKQPLTQSDPLAFPYPENPATTESTEAPKTKTLNIQPQTLKEVTTPIYTLKYRSFIDLQDFRCSRDSAQSPRPKEIAVTVDVPLLKSARDANLEIKNKTLLLESNKPAYRLELPLAYPVDEDKGYAKFNKQKGQLTIILPVLPSREALHFCQTDSACKRDEEEFEVEASGVEEKWEEQEEECEKDEVDGKGEQEKIVERKESECEICDKDACCTVRCTPCLQIPAPCNESYCCFESNVKTSEINEEAVVTAENDYSNVKLNQVETQALLMNQKPSETTQMALAVSAMALVPDHSNQAKDGSMSLGTDDIKEIPAEENEIDDDDDDLLPLEQTFPSLDCQRKPPPALLRETKNEDGEETVIDNHSARITFQNYLLYELD